MVGLVLFLRDLFFLFLVALWHTDETHAYVACLLLVIFFLDVARLIFVAHACTLISNLDLLRLTRINIIRQRLYIKSVFVMEVQLLRHLLLLGFLWFLPKVLVDLLLNNFGFFEHLIWVLDHLIMLRGLDTSTTNDL